MNERREQARRINGVAVFEEIAVDPKFVLIDKDSNPSARRYPRTRLRP